MVRKVSKDFWKIVRRVMVENYDLLKTERLRQGYYIVREKLDALIGKEILKEDFEYFINAKSGAYNYYTQDAWTQLERQGYERPEAKPVGNLWTHTGKYPIEDFYMVWDQARGFIFTEKSGEKLEELTRFGWMIIEPEKGFPTRLIREECKKDGRPVVAINDADISGEEIATSLGTQTVRTTHLDIAIEDVTPIGLRWEDVEKLNLPLQLEVKKHREKRAQRCELESFSALKLRHGIKNPFLEYVIMRMIQEGIQISPTSKDKRVLLKYYIISRLKEDIAGIITPVVEEFVDKVEIEDPQEAVRVKSPFTREKAQVDLEALVKEVSSKMVEEISWKYEEDYEDEAEKMISDEFRKLMD